VGGIQMRGGAAAPRHFSSHPGNARWFFSMPPRARPAARCAEFTAVKRAFVRLADFAMPFGAAANL